MSNMLSSRPRGRPFEKGRSGNPVGRRLGSRNKATLAAAALLAGEAEALTRKAVEMALAGDPTAMRLCMERVLPPCRERTVKFSLPSIDGAFTGETCGLSYRLLCDVTAGCGCIVCSHPLGTNASYIAISFMWRVQMRRESGALDVP